MRLSLSWSINHDRTEVSVHSDKALSIKECGYCFLLEFEYCVALIRGRRIPLNRSHADRTQGMRIAISLTDVGCIVVSIMMLVGQTWTEDSQLQGRA